MTIELTKDNLQKCGFDNEQILKLLEWDNYATSFFLKDTCYYATNIEKKIYTEIDGFRKYYFEDGTISFPMDCPDLIPTYFDLFLKKYLDKQEELLNTMFVEADQKEIFINKQILAVKNDIDENKEKILKRIHTDLYHKKDSIYNSYLRLLENKLNEQPQQTELEPLDLSDTSAVEKIIYLNELGIIDFLKTKPEFIGSTNLMATILSAITDVKASTLQTSLNRLNNNDTDDKNHPYRTKTTVERVRQTLIDKNIKPKAS